MYKKLRLILRFVIPLFLPALVLAAGTSAHVTWTLPTQYIDGTALPATDIASSTISWTRIGSATVIGSRVVNSPGTVADIPGLICGQYSFSITVLTTATATYPSIASDPTGPVTFPTNISCKPNPPTGVTVS